MHKSIHKRGTIPIKKRIVTAITALALLTPMLALYAAPAFGFAGGTGTQNDPFLIATAAQLRSIPPGAAQRFYRLENDIDLGSVPFTPIGQISSVASNTALRFNGELDGNGKTIRNLNANSNTGAGLFGAVGTAVIRNLTIEGASVTGNYNVGTLVGYSYSGITIINSKVTGSSVFATGINLNAGGGLVGSSNGNLRIENSSFSGSVNSNGGRIGGLVGTSHSSGTITRSFSAGSVSSTNSFVGGLVGWGRITIRESYSAANVTGFNDTGGLLGKSVGSSRIENSFSTGRITGNGRIGGIAGDLGAHESVLRTYATGEIRSTGNANQVLGGLVGDKPSNATVSRNVVLSPRVTADRNTPSIRRVMGANSTSNLSLNYARSDMTLMAGGSIRTPVDSAAGRDGASRTLASMSGAASQPFYQNTLLWDFATVWYFDPAVWPYPLLKNVGPDKISVTPETADVFAGETTQAFTITAACRFDTISHFVFDNRLVNVTRTGNRTFTVTGLSPADAVPVTVYTNTGKPATVTVRVLPKPTLEDITVALGEPAPLHIGNVTAGAAIQWNTQPNGILVLFPQGNPTVITGTRTGTQTVSATVTQGTATVTLWANVTVVELVLSYESKYLDLNDPARDRFVLVATIDGLPPWVGVEYSFATTSLDVIIDHANPTDNFAAIIGESAGTAEIAVTATIPSLGLTLGPLACDVAVVSLMTVAQIDGAPPASFDAIINISNTTAPVGLNASYSWYDNNYSRYGTTSNTLNGLGYMLGQSVHVIASFGTPNSDNSTGIMVGTKTTLIAGVPVITHLAGDDINAIINP
jgi:hypothetical protein